MTRILALCGGVGGAKLAWGLAQILAPEDLAIVVNTGDDFEHLGLAICPDIDTVLYTLSGRAHRVQGWGRADESWQVMGELRALGAEDWFQLGDKDIALHLIRRAMLDRGIRLTEATRVLATKLGVAHPVLPMSDAPVRTRVETDQGVLAFQDYFVRRRCAPRVSGFRFEGAATALPAPEVTRALSDPALEGILICPSNPYVSVGPILAVPALRAALAARRVPVLAVSPIVGGQALKGPAAKMMGELGLEISALAVARHYRGLIDGLVIDTQDRDLLDRRSQGDPALYVAPTVMTGERERTALAGLCLDVLQRRAAG